MAKWNHGFFLKAAVAERRRMRAMIAKRGKLIKALRARPGSVTMVTRATRAAAEIP
jgi:hypothetical protein